MAKATNNSSKSQKSSSKKNGKNNSKDSDEPDIQELFEDEIKKPYYKVDYLDNFKLPYDKLDVSVVIPTYNRAPYKPNSLKGDLNPLAWAIESVLLQKPKISEIIVVDDCSEDYTKEVVESFRKECKSEEITLIYVKNNTRQGYSKSINVGAGSANSRYLLFVDDDSIVAPYASFGAIYTFSWLKEEGVNVGIVNLSPYSRSSFPDGIVPKEEIGQLDFSKGMFTTKKNMFPTEYLQEESHKLKFIHGDYHILKPLQIKNSGGYFLCTKEVFLSVGGFPETISERFMDSEFGSRVFENGYSIYHSVDPKFHCVHGSYGLHTGKIFEGDDWFRKIGGRISLKKSMSTCDNPQANTGCRINVHKVIYSSISSLFWMIYKRNVNGAAKWMKRVYENFVKKGETDIINVNIPESIPEDVRIEIWNTAIKNSLMFIEQTEKEKLKNIRKMKKKLDKEKKISSDTLIKFIEG